MTQSLFQNLLLSSLWLLCVCCSACIAPPSAHDVPAYVQAKEIIDRGVVLLREKKFNAAEAAFRLSLEISELPESWDGLGCIALALKDFARARQLFFQAIDVNPDYSEAWANLALLEEMQGRQKNAEELYMHAASLSPASAKIRNNYGALLWDAAKIKHTVTEKSLAQTFLQQAAVLQDDGIVRRNISVIRRTELHGGIKKAR